MPKSNFSDNRYLLHSNDDYEPYGLSMPSQHMALSGQPTSVKTNHHPQVVTLAIAEMNKSPPSFSS